MSSEEIAWADSILIRAVDDRMYGSVTIHMEAGRIVRIEKTESFKPTNKKPLDFQVKIR